MMGDNRQVAIILDPDDIDEELALCSYTIDGKLTKIQDKTDLEKESTLASIQRFLNTHLPYIKFHDVNPFELLDPDVDSFDTRIFRVKDAMLERDIEVSNSVGLRKGNKTNLETSRDHFYLPGLPNLVYEDYPMFRPDIESSFEYTNEDYYKRYVKGFLRLVSEKVKKGGRDLATKFEQIRDVYQYQSPVEYEAYFSFSVDEFADVFIYRIFESLLSIYQWLILPSEKDLKKYFKREEGIDDSYHPVLGKDAYKSLKPIGSVVESPFAFGIFDSETEMINKLLVHVELVNLSLGISEGYELYFNTNKRNFDTEKLTGSEHTKIDNFLKRFTKCVSICLNSKTNRFIIFDYYWCGMFEIEDVGDGEIKDAIRFISKVKVRHFGFSNFENDNHLTIRNIIGSFFNFKPSEFSRVSTNIENLNNKVVKEWKQFQKKKDNIMINNSQYGQRKRLKQSPFVFRTVNGLEFTKQQVDLSKALKKFIAIGHQWSCQTLCIDLKHLYLDKSYFQKLNIDPKQLKKDYLISIYDEYYQEADLSMITRHLKNADLKFGSTKAIENSKLVFTRWISNVEGYRKAKSLQGDVIAKVVDYGYLEDKPYNGKNLHFKTDGYYIVYQPITNNDVDEDDDLEPVDVNNAEHYKLAKEALTKLHKCGVSFYPYSHLSKDVLKYYNGKVYIINLEDCNLKGPSDLEKNSYAKKDMVLLDRLFNKKTDSVKTPFRVSHSRSRSKELPRNILQMMSSYVENNDDWNDSDIAIHDSDLMDSDDSVY